MAVKFKLVHSDLVRRFARELKKKKAKQTIEVGRG